MVKTYLIGSELIATLRILLGIRQHSGLDLEELCVCLYCSSHFGTDFDSLLWLELEFKITYLILEH